VSEKKWCAGDSCGYMTLPTGAGPFGCGYDGYCVFQRPLGQELIDDDRDILIEPGKEGLPDEYKEWTCSTCGSYNKEKHSFSAPCIHCDNGDKFTERTEKKLQSPPVSIRCLVCGHPSRSCICDYLKAKNEIFGGEKQ